MVLWCQTFIPNQAPMLPPSGSQQQQRSFRYAPPMFFRLQFVNAINHKGDDIDDKQTDQQLLHTAQRLFSHHSNHPPRKLTT